MPKVNGLPSVTRHQRNVPNVKDRDQSNKHTKSVLKETKIMQEEKKYWERKKLIYLHNKRHCIHETRKESSKETLRKAKYKVFLEIKMTTAEIKNLINRFDKKIK